MKLFKKISITLCGILLSVGFLNASHDRPRDASSLNRGTVPPERLPVSSATLRGQLNDASQGLMVASLTVTGNIVSTTGFRGDGSGLTGILATGFSGGLAGTQTLAGDFILNNNGLRSSHTLSGISGGLVKNGLDTIFASMTNLRSATNTWTASQEFKSSISITVPDYISNVITIGTASSRQTVSISTGAMVIDPRGVLPSTFTPSNALTVVDLGSESNGKIEEGALVIVSTGGANKRMAFGYESQNEYGFINVMDRPAGGTIYKNLILQRGGGRVGIGTASPLQSFHANGIAYFNNNVGVGANPPTSKVDIVGGSLTIRGSGAGLNVNGLNGCNTIDTDANGNFICGTDEGGNVVPTKTFDLIIGSPGAQGVNAYMADDTGWNLNLASVGARGLIESATATARIFIKDGSYLMANAYIPRGIKVYGSSAVFVMTGAAVTTAQIWGLVDGVKFDAAGIDMSTGMVVMRNGGRLRNSEIYGNQNMTGGSNFYDHPLSIIDAADVIVEDTLIRDVKAVNGINIAGDIGAWAIRNSSNVYFRRNKMIATVALNTDGGHSAINISSNIFIQDNEFINVNGNILSIMGGNKDIHIERNKYKVQGADTENIRIISFSNSLGQAASTGVVIRDNYFDIGDAVGLSAENIIVNQAGAGSKVSGVVISGNIAKYNFGTVNTWTFVDTGSNSLNWVMLGNQVFGINTFLSDSSVGTKNTGNDNYFNGVEQ